MLHTLQVVEHARQLAWSDSGNYVIQCILKYCSEEDRWGPNQDRVPSGSSICVIYVQQCRAGLLRLCRSWRTVTFRILC